VERTLHYFKKIGDMDYTSVMGGKMKTFHANPLKKYIERDISTCGVLPMCASSLIDFSDEDADKAQDPIVLSPIIQTETVEDIHFGASCIRTTSNA
jgi:hypothetical protein